LCEGKISERCHTHSLWPPSPLIVMMETQATTHCCLEPFSVGIPLWMGF
jgi:hypothetical protein